MNIELKQAAQQALLALENSQPHPSNPVIGLTNQDFINHEETIRQLRTAIQQAEAQQPDNTACKSVQKRLEAQQPATGEPDEWKLVPIVPTEKMLLAYTGGAVTNAGFRWCRHQWSVMLAAAPAAHPAPIVPATTEPVVSRNPFASRCYTMSESHLSGHRLIVGFEKLGDVQDAHEWVARQARGDFTHPAPSVPDSYEKAISSGCFGVLPVKATIPMCKAGWGASGGELTFQQIGHIYEEMYKARPLPDAAMITAK